MSGGGEAKLICILILPITHFLPILRQKLIFYPIPVSRRGKWYIR